MCSRAKMGPFVNIRKQPRVLEAALCPQALTRSWLVCIRPPFHLHEILPLWPPLCQTEGDKADRTGCTSHQTIISLPSFLEKMLHSLSNFRAMLRGSECAVSTRVNAEHSALTRKVLDHSGLPGSFRSLQQQRSPISRNSFPTLSFIR